MTASSGGSRPEEPDERRGAPRIPGPRQAGDNLDPAPRLDQLPPFSGPDDSRHRMTTATPGPDRFTDRAENPPDDQADGTDRPERGDRAADGELRADGGEQVREGAGPAELTTPAPAGSADAGTTATVDVPLTAGDLGGGRPDGELPHTVLKSLLGAWALSACSAEETLQVEAHLTECAACADEALRLRDAVALLHTDQSLDLDPLLRSRVLENCLGRRPARIPVPEWAAPYDAETARLDALLRDFGDAEWHAPVRLRWFQDERLTSRRTTVAGIIGHLLSVDGLVARALGLADPLGSTAPVTPAERTENFWGVAQPHTLTVREPWREQSHTLIRAVSFADLGAAELSVSYGDFALPLRDALLDRAFECWVHAEDIADAVSYPYEPPSGPHVHRMIDLAARLLPAALAARRQGGLAAPARDLVAVGAPGRSLHLEIEGRGGGDWYIALDSPAAIGSPDRSVAQIALDGIEFCQLVAGHVSPEEAAAGQDGDREAIRDVLFAAAAMSRL